MRHIDSDGNTTYDGEVGAAPRRKQAAVTPKSAAFGSPVPIDPWTGGLPAQPMEDDGPKQAQARRRQQERRAKPSFFDTGSAPASNREQEEYVASLDQEREPLISSSSVRAAADESSDPFHPPRKYSKKQIDVIDSTYPDDDVFSDPKGTSPTPRPRTSTSQIRKDHETTVTLDQAKKKGMFQFSSLAASLSTQPVNSPNAIKLTDAMRGTSALAPTQENSAKTTFKEKGKRNRTSSKRSMLAALDRVDPELAGADDPFDTANVPPSQNGSPGAVRSRGKALPKQPVLKSKQLATRKNKQANKIKPPLKFSPPVKQDEAKKSDNIVRQKGDDFVDSNPKPETKDETLPQITRQTRQRRRVRHVEADQEPITITSGSSVYDSADLESITDKKDTDYTEKDKNPKVVTSGQATRARKRARGGSKQRSGPTEKAIRREEELNPQAQSADVAEGSSLKETSSVKMVAPITGDSSESRFSLPTTQKRKNTKVASPKIPERDIGNLQTEAPLGTVKTSKQEPRKPTIIPFDATGPKTNGVSRHISTAKASSKASRRATDIAEDKTKARPLRRTAAPENTQPSDQQDSREIKDKKPMSKMSEADDYAPRTVDACVVEGLSFSTKGQSRAQGEGHYLVISANEEGMVSNCPSQEAAAPSNDQTNVQDEGQVFMDDNDDLAHEHTQVSQEFHHRHGPDHSSTDDDHLINQHSSLVYSSKKSSEYSPIKVKAGLKRSLPPDKNVQPLPSMEYPTSSNLSHEAAQCLQPHTFQQMTVNPFERATKKQRLIQTQLESSLETKLPQSAQKAQKAQKALQPPIKRSSGESSGLRRRRRSTKPNNTLDRSISIDLDGAGPVPGVGAKPSKVCSQGLTETFSESKPAPKRNIAQQFLTDMTTRSNAFDQDDKSKLPREDLVVDVPEDVPWREEHRGHQKLSHIRRISERERAFEETQATPEQAVGKVMHRIVGVCFTC